MYLPAFCRPLFGSPGIFLVWGHCPGTSVHCHLCSLPLFWEYLRGLRSLSWCGWAERRKRTRGRTDMWQLIRSNPCQWSQPFHSFNVLHYWPCFYPGKQSPKSDFPFQQLFKINFSPGCALWSWSCSCWPSRWKKWHLSHLHTLMLLVHLQKAKMAK